MKVLFDCHACDLKNAEAEVKDRGKNEPLSSWMPKVGKAVAIEHQRRRPGCRSPQVDLKIPLPEDGGKVGQAP